MDKLFTVLAAGVLVLGLAAAVALITGFFVMLCWNYLFTGDASIIGTALPEIGYWQGFVLSFFGSLVFKGSSSSSSD